MIGPQAVAALQATGGAQGGTTLQAILNVYGPPILGRIYELLTAPLANPAMIWFVTPLILITLFMTLYFGAHPHEELGWNTALGNSLVLLFVSIDLLRYLYNLSDPGSITNYFLQPVKTLVVLGVALEGLFLLFANFLHFLPKRLAFFISSALPVNLTAYVVMAIVYTDVEIDWITLAAALVLFFALLILLTFLQVLERATIRRIVTVREREEIEAEIRKKVEEELKRKEEEKKEEGREMREEAEGEGEEAGEER
jgi:signal transduction histidine kinase